MELDPDLQFKHYTVAEAHLPAESLSRMQHVSLDEVEICCDLEHHVFNHGHTDPGVVEALAALTGSRPRVGELRPGRGQHLLERGLTTLRHADDRRPYRGDAATVSSGCGRPRRGHARRRRRGGARGRPHSSSPTTRLSFPPTPGPSRIRGGLGSAVEPRSLLQTHVLVVNADLPAATPPRFGSSPVRGSRSWRRRRHDERALAPGSVGVRALYRPARGSVPGACRVRHGLDPELQCDVDQDADLERIAPRVGPRTRALRPFCVKTARLRLAVARQWVYRNHVFSREAFFLSVGNPGSPPFPFTGHHALAGEDRPPPGGGGGARFARGLAGVLGEDELTVVGNVGDDVEILGLHVSPDVEACFTRSPG
jgi:hypothetical protein